MKRNVQYRDDNNRILTVFKCRIIGINNEQYGFCRIDAASGTPDWHETFYSGYASFKKAKKALIEHATEHHFVEVTPINYLKGADFNG